MIELFRKTFLPKGTTAKEWKKLRPEQEKLFDENEGKELLKELSKQ